MKKLFISTLFLSIICVGEIYSQNQAVTNTHFFYQDGEYDKAKTEIDKAVKHEKTVRKGKTWFYKGMVYEAIYITPKFANIAENSLAHAIEAYKKALQLDGPSSEYGAQVPARLDNCWRIAINEGGEKYQAKDFAAAIKSYKLAQLVNPKDTTALIYASYAAESGKDKETLKDSYKKLKELDYLPATLYSMMARVYIDENNMDEAMKLLEEGSIKYPDNQELRTSKLNLFLKMGKEVEALDEFRKAVNEDPTNHLLWSKLGDIYGQMARQAEEKNPTDSAIIQYTKLAKESYSKAIEIDTTFSIAFFNLGVIYNNAAAKRFNMANETSDLKKMQVYQKEGEDQLKLAMPFLEKAHQLTPDDKETSQILMKLYLTLKMNDKATEIKSSMGG